MMQRRPAQRRRNRSSGSNSGDELTQYPPGTIPPTSPQAAPATHVVPLPLPLPLPAMAGPNTGRQHADGDRDAAGDAMEQNRQALASAGAQDLILCNTQPQQDPICAPG